VSRSILALATLTVVATACSPSIRLQVLEPSLVTSPPDVHRLAVVDRSRAKNVGEGILGALESIATGEGIGADNEGRSRAMTAVVRGLQDSPRFDAAEVFVPRKELESSLFDKELSWATAKRICKDAGCQGIVALEAFDSDSSVNVDRRVTTETDSDGKERQVVTFEAQRRTNVVTAWRYYDVVNKQIIDDVRGWDSAYTWTETGPSVSAARGALPPQGDAVSYVGSLAGASYARRIAPTWVWVTRSYYGGGHPDLKLGKNHVRAMDWAGAVDIWDDLYRNGPDAKTRGKAAFNLALAAEREGDLRNAASWATEAAVLLANGRARGYRASLERRLADQLKVQQQMELTAPGQVEEDRPLAKPHKPAPPSGRGPAGNRGTSGDAPPPPPPPKPGTRGPTGNR